MEAWNSVQQFLGLMQRRAYQHLYHNGPATAKELGRDRKDAGWGFSKRLSELERLGLVVEFPKRECHVTGRNAIVWDVTSKVLTGHEIKVKNKTVPKNAELVRAWARISELKADIDELHEIIARLTKPRRQLDLFNSITEGKTQ